jgi:hypothetical protein
MINHLIWIQIQKIILHGHIINKGKYKTLFRTSSHQVFNNHFLMFLYFTIFKERETCVFNNI